MVSSDVWFICELGSDEDREFIDCVGGPACRRGFDALRGVESVCVIWEEVSVNVLQSAVGLSVVVDELLTCGRVGSDVMYVEEACKDVPPGKLVQERGRSSRSKSTRVGNKGDNGDRSLLAVDVK